MTTTINTQAIADKINAAGQTYYGERARGWVGGEVARIYFGREFVTIEQSGEAHNRTAKARSKSIGESAVEMVQAAMEALSVMLTVRQRELIAIYANTYPHIAELSERAEASDGDLKTLGDAMAVQPYPPGVTGSDALEIGRIGLD